MLFRSVSQSRYGSSSKRTINVYSTKTHCSTRFCITIINFHCDHNFFCTTFTTTFPVVMMYCQSIYIKKTRHIISFNQRRFNNIFSKNQWTLNGLSKRQIPSLSQTQTAIILKVSPIKKVSTNFFFIHALIIIKWSFFLIGLSVG